MIYYSHACFDRARALFLQTTIQKCSWSQTQCTVPERTAGLCYVTNSWMCGRGDTVQLSSLRLPATHVTLWFLKTFSLSCDDQRAQGLMGSGSTLDAIRRSVCVCVTSVLFSHITQERDHFPAFASWCLLTHTSLWTGLVCFYSTVSLFLCFLTHCIPISFLSVLLLRSAMWPVNPSLWASPGALPGIMMFWYIENRFLPDYVMNMSGSHREHRAMERPWHTGDMYWC